MRFKRYLEEDSTFFDVMNSKFEDVWEGSSEFIKEYFPKKLFLYRGMSSKPDISKISVRKERIPSSTPKEVNDYINKYFKSKGFASRDESIFVSGNKDLAGGYGAIYIIIPIGNFDFVWSKEIDDFYERLPYIKNDELTDKQRLDIELMLDTYINKDFGAAIKSGHEIWIDCKEYWAISYDRPILRIFMEWLKETKGIKT